MRNQTIKKILDLFNSMQEAQNDACQLSVSGNEDGAAALLSQCQEAAISIGNEIERTEGCGTETERSLERYCEDLFQTSLSVSDGPEDLVRNGNGIQKAHAYEKLTKSLRLCRDLFRREIRPQYELLFLPYKASMWDALESIYLAAKRDPRCLPVVMPIPYFDRNQDGSLGDGHYEGGSFPSYIPITDYHSYSVKEHHPDAIFIHNPYDNANYATTVHPDYYCKRLKDLTDFLAYIPYYIEETDDEGRCDNHIPVTSGVLNSTLISAQNAYIADVWTRQLASLSGNTPQAVKFWQNRIRPFGSPKVDAVLNPPVPDTYPEEWRPFLKRQVPVLFYNTSLTAMLNSTHPYLAKLRAFFEYLSTHQEVVLLWRPHPLMQTTMKSLRPDLLPGYLELVDFYKENGLGIYDGTGDLDRAIRLSSAYYGDRFSSVIELFHQSGRIILTQDPAITDYSDTVDPEVKRTFSTAQRLHETTGHEFASLCEMLVEKTQIPLPGAEQAKSARASTAGQKILLYVLNQLETGKSKA